VHKEFNSITNKKAKPISIPIKIGILIKISKFSQTNLVACYKKIPLTSTEFENKKTVTTTNAKRRTRIIPTKIFDPVYGVSYTKVSITKTNITPQPT
jgi:hypothetical protein